MTKTTIKVGNVYVLNCGVEVVVKEYISSRKVIVEDSEGNQKMVKAALLPLGQIKWDSLSGGESNVPPVGHYVYFVWYKNAVVYIGKGVGWRFRHALSGKSSSYQLNKLHFSGEEVTVTIHKEGLTAFESRKEELTQIRLLCPPFNVVSNSARMDAALRPTAGKLYRSRRNTAPIVRPTETAVMRAVNLAWGAKIPTGQGLFTKDAYERPSTGRR